MRLKAEPIALARDRFEMKDRRESCCPSCSRLYRSDAYQLLAAGLRGGKSVPESVATHPVVILTLTAPSFGAVHGNPANGRSCRCGRRHDHDDTQLGTVIDPDGYRYTEQALWNRYAPELWKRTVQSLRRGLANALGVPRSKLAETACVRFAKVAEFQRRGVVHYHALIRIDGPDGNGDPPPATVTPELLAQLADAAVDAAFVSVPELVRTALGPGTPAKLRWGEQHEVTALDVHTCAGAAGYIAKYATKATETVTGGTLLKPIRSASCLAYLPLSSHARTLVSTSWQIGERTGDETFQRWAHQFGYGGHTLTKSRNYSVTFTALRAARSSWRLGESEDHQVIIRAQLTYAGRGHDHPRGRQ